MAKSLACNHDSRPAVFILHYGSSATTRRLHRQLLASDPGWKERIMVLDNHAPESYPDAWQRLDENLFWCGALDYALHVCRDQGWPYLWFFNNDAFFISNPPHLEKAWQRLRKIERTLGPAGIYSPSFEHHPYHPQMVASPGYAYRRAKCVDGVAPLINLECWQALGGLDCGDNPRGYGVDLCFSLRASRRGWPVIVDHHVHMRHIYHSTAGSIPGFLVAAAAQEKAYLEARLGLGYGEILRQAQIDFHDEVQL
ncbi:glycosyltransferase family 2 protein [Desulfonatronum parangueonense]